MQGTADEPLRLRLDADKIVETIEKLEQRVDQRFTDRGINQRTGDLLRIAKRARLMASTIGRPIRWVRVCLALLLSLFIAGLFVIPFDLSSEASQGRDAFEWLQILEAGLNDVVLIGAGALFLVTVETRIKRRRCLRELHELRSYAHVVDMMQLTKDPQRANDGSEDTPASPNRDLTDFELSRYLDYCSELLSLTGKLAALYVQDFDDPVALSAVKEIEDLTTGLSRKIWQKLMVLSAYSEDVHESAPRRSEAG